MSAAQPLWPAEVRGGKVHLWRKPEYDRYVGSLPEGSRVDVIVRVRHKRPTVAMHRFYRGVILPTIAEEMGDSLLETHRLLKFEFFANGGRSLGKISRALFRDFLEFCCRVAAWLDIVITDPDLVEV